MELPAEPPVQPPSLTIVIAEPDREALQALQGLLRSRSHRVIGLPDRADLFDMLSASQPDCVIVSLDADAVETIKTLAERHPDVPILAISGDTDPDMVVRTIKAGAGDYVAKPYDMELVIARAEQLGTGRREIASAPSPGIPARGFRMLTGREHEVLTEIAGGASSKEVGRRLGISPRTVDVHRARIKEKLQVRRAVDLVRLVYDAKILESKG